MTKTADPPRTFDLAVLGAGPMGLVAAAMAARAGLSVMLVDRAEDFGRSAGWRSGGMLAPDCEAEVSSPAVVDAGRRSMALWPEIAEGVTLRGTLVVAPPRDPGSLDRFARMTARHRRVDADEVAVLEPALAGRFRAGLFFAKEGHLDPRRTMAALRADLEMRGVTVVFGWRGEAAALPARTVLDATGMGARVRLSDLRGVKGEMALIRCPEIALNRPVRLLHHRHPLYVVPRADHVFMIGATTVESESEAVSLRGAGELLTQAYALHPAFADAEVLEFNAGLRPAFPDNEPRIFDEGRTLAVNGLYRHGWLLAPALAERILQRIEERTHAAEAER